MSVLDLGDFRLADPDRGGDLVGGQPCVQTKSPQLGGEAAPSRKQIRVSHRDRSWRMSALWRRRLVIAEADGVHKGEIPLFAAAVEILGRHALVAEEPAALVVAEPDAGLVVDEHEVLS